MAITAQHLLQILPNARPVAGIFVPVLNAAMNRYAIVTRLRVAAFIAQIGHESGQLRYLRERGGDAYLARYDTGRLAARLGNTPEADGDGQRYAGRGLIHLTGLRNYRACSEALGIDFVAEPQRLEEPVHAAMSAGWYWATNGLNTLADHREFETITRRINGGLNGQTERLAYYERALEVLP
ncbi:prophage PSPPH02 chitinase [Pseudomonas sp. StFLB209]|uniref:glycoside hydrolase family 19 protein n=1 Tax=Pseudomonas sp. StFLB209 TaxID=1028989 RepID=UPI0004F85716|nr:glycoside hydrolase family 19 protein [Pseudomonas sp. StFLB209]BAP44781.1 prophage PSPPH02 chitinase [Pseudomonas sp. StFLB209]